jgi:glycosyltransferase involved in cell wall biosynthesis
VQSGKFDLIHTHLIHADLYGSFVARLAGVSHLVSTKHNDDAFRTNAFIKVMTRIANRRCDRIIAISRHLGDFVQRVEGVKPEKIVPIHYGMMVSAGWAGDSEGIRRELSLGGDERLVLSIGRLTEQKGHRYLLEAWRRISSECPRGRLLLVGDGPARERLTRHAERLGVAGSVIFLGWRKDVPRLLEAGDVVVHPSLWEGFGLVLLEAMAAGKPVVGTNVSAIPEIVADGGTGLLVPPRDPSALAEAVLRLLRDAGLRSAMGCAGRERVNREFTVDKMVSAHEAVYGRVLTEGSGATEK